MLYRTFLIASIIVLLASLLPVRAQENDKPGTKPEATEERPEPEEAPEAKPDAEPVDEQSTIQRETLDICFDFTPWLENDYETLTERVLVALDASPADVATLALAELYGYAFDYMPDPDALTRKLAELSDDGTNLEIFGANARTFAGWLAAGAIQIGRFEVARNVEAATAGLKSWLVAGPFGSPRGGDYHYDTLPPELLVTLEKPMPGEYGPVNWMEWKPELPSQHYFTPGHLFKRGGGGWFGLTEVTNPGEERDVLLDVEVGAGGVKLWLNGEMVLNRRPDADYSRDDVTVVTLPTGRSTLLIKFGVETSGGVRICDPHTRLTITEITASVPTELEPFVPRGGVDPLANPVPPAYQRLVPLVSDEDETLRAQATVLLAMQLANYGHPEMAEDYWHFTRLYRESDALRDACLDLIYESYGTLTTSADKRRIRRERLTWLEKEFPEALRPKLGLAQLHADEDREIPATELLDKALELKGTWDVHLACAGLYANLGSDRSWNAEARKHRLMAYKSTSEPPPQLLLNRARLAADDGNLKLASELLDQLLQGPWKGNTSVLHRRMYIAQRLGQDDVVDGCLDLLAEVQGGVDRELRRERAEIISARGRWKEACNIYLELGKERPRSAPSNYHSAGELAYRHGDLEKAMSAFQKALELDPGRDSTRRYMDRIEGRRLSVLPEFSTEVTPDILDSLQATDYPLATAGYLLDEEVWLVESDGSFTAYGQRVLKVFQQDGVDQFGRTNISGEVLRVRTITPDGGDLEPVSVTGQSFEFPGVEPGCAIDYAYRLTFRSDDYETLDDRLFWFRENALQMPTALARLVVVLPPGFTANYREYGMENAAFELTELEDGRIVYSWELRDPRSDEHEAGMPRNEEIIPMVEFVRVENEWESQARGMRSSLKTSKATWLVRQTVAEILESGEPAPITNIARAQALYEWVNETIKTVGGGTNPHTTLQQKSGSRKGLFLAMLDAANVRYRLALAGYDPDSTPTRGRYLQYGNVFRDPLILVEDEDQRTYISMAYRQAPFGYLGVDYYEAPVLLLDPVTSDWELGTMPGGKPDVHGQSLSVEFLLDAEGRAKVKGAVVQAGDYGYEDKEEARVSSRTDLKQSLDGELSMSLPGIVVTEFETPGLEALGVDFVRTFKGSLQTAATKEGKALRLKPHLKTVRDSLNRYVAKDKRQFDIVFYSDLVKDETLRYLLPDGFTLAELPDDFILPVAPFNYSLTYRLEGNVLTVKRSLRFRAQRVPVADYDSFREQVKAMSEAEEKALILVPIK